MIEGEDITLEFYWKNAVFVSPYSGVKVFIEIKKVEKIKTDKGFQNLITSTEDIYYLQNELTDFTI